MLVRYSADKWDVGGKTRSASQHSEGSLSCLLNNHSVHCGQKYKLINDNSTSTTRLKQILAVNA